MFEQFTRNRVLVYLKKNADYGFQLDNKVKFCKITTIVVTWIDVKLEKSGII